MSFTPNRIKLITRGRLEEALQSGTIYPGMLLQRTSAAPSAQIATVTPHPTYGGEGSWVVGVEDALHGQDITQVYAAGSIPISTPAKDDELLMLLQNGQNVGVNVGLCSAGDGTLVANIGPQLYIITAASTAITNTNTETTFSNGSYSIPANFLQAGDIIHIRARATVTGQTASATQNVKLYFGASNLLCSSTAQNLAANNQVLIDQYITIRTSGSSGTYVASGEVSYGSETASTSNATFALSATVNTAAAVVVSLSGTCNANNTANTIELDEFCIEVDRPGGFHSICTSLEAINNSSGTGTSAFNSAAFIRCVIN